MALPTFVAKGAFASGQPSITAQPPSGASQPTTRLLLGVVVTAAQGLPGGSPQTGNGVLLGQPGGWQYLNGGTTGTSGVAGGLLTEVYWKWGANTGDVLDDQLVTGDSGDVNIAMIFTFDGCKSSGPINVTGTNTQATATTAMSVTGVTTTLNDCLIVNCTGIDLDSASTAVVGACTNASLGSITEQHDQTVIAGTGGGLAVVTGTKATAGATGTTTATVTSTKMIHVVVALNGVLTSNARSFGVII